MFRNESSLFWRVLIPGGAYFYAGQSGLGVLHAIVDSLISLDLLMVGITLFSGIASGKLVDAALSDTEAAFVYVLAVTILEKLVAVFHARRFIREFIPVEGTSHQQKLQAAGTSLGGA